MEASALIAAVRSANRVLLTGPEDPDGDSIGACLALQRAIGAVSGARVEVAGVAPHRYRWLAGATEMVPDADIAAPYEVAVVLDGDRSRLPAPVSRAYESAPFRAIIDHHATTTAEGYDLALIDGKAASTCCMVLDLLDRWGVALDKPTAELLYTGMIFDTGGFRYSNTMPRTHRAAARLLEAGIDHAAICVRLLMERRAPGMRLQGQVLSGASFHGGGAVLMGRVPMRLLAELGCETGDLEGLVDSLVYVEGVEVAVLLIERPNGDTKLSLRSRGRVNVSKVARALRSNGGGHAKAAGVVLPESLDAVAGRLPEVLVQAVRES